MTQARWSRRAAEEFEDLVRYLKQHNAKAADHAAEDIIALSRLLARRPGLGRPGQRKGTQEFSIARWNKVMVYRAGDGFIDITTLRDPRMLSKPEYSDVQD